MGEERPQCGSLISKYLLSNNDEEPCPPLFPFNSDEERDRRKRSPSACSDAPKPKKMPRPKVRPPASVHSVPEAQPVLMTLHAKAKSPVVVPPPSTSHNAVRLISHNAVIGRRQRPDQQWFEDPEVHKRRWSEQQAQVVEFYRRLCAWNAYGDYALQILARHSARLGPIAAASLEEAVTRAIRMNSEYDREKAEMWHFLESEEERGAFAAAKASIVTNYSHRGRNRVTDEAVLDGLDILECRKYLAQEVILIPLGEVAPPLPQRPREDGQKGELRLLPISEIRFAHNDQSEHFVNCSKDCSILQLAVELLTGITPIEAVPQFNVCWHDGEWYCRSGNRRLAAFMLVATFAPSRFCCVWVRVVSTDTVFLQGGASGRPKLTTHLNGADCKGRWLLIKETGEAIGIPDALNAPPYGADLLALLPQPAPPIIWS